MKRYFPYNPTEPVEILGEVHTIEDGYVYLNHIPFKNSIQIEGFTQTDSQVLLPTQFFCDYGDDLYYRESSCVVYFNEQHNGTRVVVNYLCVGTIIVAEDLNEIKAHLENQKIHNTYQLPTASTLEKGGVRVGQGLQMVGDILNCTVQGGDFSAHNDSSSAHPFIQNLIGDEIQARVQSVSNLESRADSLESALNSVEDSLEDLEHNIEEVKGDLADFQDEPHVYFLGTADSLPAQNSFGELIHVGGKFYICDGNSWLCLCTCAAEPVKSWFKQFDLEVFNSNQTFAEWSAQHSGAPEYAFYIWRDGSATVFLPPEFTDYGDVYGVDYKILYPPDAKHYDTPDTFDGETFSGWLAVPALTLDPDLDKYAPYYAHHIAQFSANAAAVYSLVKE